LKIPTGVFLSSSGLSKVSFPSTRQRPDTLRGEQKRSPSSRASSTSGESQAYSCGASSETKGGSSYARSTPIHAVIMQAQEHLLGKLSDKGSTGPHLWRTPRTLCVIARHANSTLDSLTSRHKLSDHAHHMAFHCVAPRHGGAAPTGTRGLRAPLRCGRKVLQMD
jgi:hypothetical protein